MLRGLHLYKRCWCILSCIQFIPFNLYVNDAALPVDERLCHPVDSLTQADRNAPKREAIDGSPDFFWVMSILVLLYIGRRLTELSAGSDFRSKEQVGSAAGCFFPLPFFFFPTHGWCATFAVDILVDGGWNDQMGKESVTWEAIDGFFSFCGLAFNEISRSVETKNRIASVTLGKRGETSPKSITSSDRKIKVVCSELATDNVCLERFIECARVWISLSGFL